MTSIIEITMEGFEIREIKLNLNKFIERESEY